MSGAIIKRVEYAAIEQQRRACDAMHSEAARTLARARLVYETQERQGYIDGLERGRIEGAKLLVGLVDRSIAHLAALEQEIADIMDEALRKLLDDPERYAVLGSMVKKNIELLEQKQRLTLRVSPRTRARLEKSLRSLIERDFPIDIVEDDRVETDACIIEAGQSIINLNVTAQITELSRVFREAL